MLTSVFILSFSKAFYKITQLENAVFSVSNI